ncbi:hypothetical protein INR77_02360 [Erythrobacter sp. SCSIO 43205]|uniref:hypothetical protein n=1 Tax=Erythrobacter sp. SCSIO 43205 TaxID=2779361 RepID=UPI001CA96295|nr:hypothetical protein [Erythrobacter sp. SCSIO 43205]UAB78600.1 hypothetical protein INR77_02360 [Erythrobacter sp. SCSIO 43205]
MQSSKHIGTIVRNHADAVENGKSSARKRKAKASGSSFATVPKHRAFVPMVTIWGGLLMALIMAVMPDYAIARASSLSGVYLPLIAARLILALGVGCAGALLGFIVASAIANYTKARKGDDALVSKAFKSREFEPINPASDLGSVSLDAPIDQSDTEEPQPFKQTPFEEAPSKPSASTPGPTLGELAQRGFEMDAPDDIHSDSDSGAQGDDSGNWAFTRKHFKDALIESCEGATCEAAGQGPDGVRAFAPRKPQAGATESGAAETGAAKDGAAKRGSESGFASLSAEQITPQRKPLGEKPGALDLGGFSVVPDETAHDAPAPSPEFKPATALEALRQKPTDELSLVEMVERFAAALHERQAKERAQFENTQKSRDAALAEALKALTLFTENGFDTARHQAQPAAPTPSNLDETEEELRSALSRLQGLRGAA